MRHRVRHRALGHLVLLLLVLAGTSRLFAQTWPTYRHDNRRSGVTAAELPFPLVQLWAWQSPQRPQTAWSGPAKWDAYSGNEGLQSMRNFDPCFYVTADQQTVYFGSSVDDAAHALDAKSGEERWVHITGAAVRLPPTLAGGQVYFGSDDGFLYSCDGETGDLIWKTAATNANRRIASNRKLISLWPIRTGALVDGARVSFAGSLVPWESSILLTVDRETGQVRGDGCFRRELSGVTLQGAMLASSDLLYVPQGRAAPLAFARADGSPRGAVGEAGGVFCVLSEDEQLFAGPPNQRQSEEQIRITGMGSDSAIASFSGTNRILVDGDLAWLWVDGQLKMLDRKAYVLHQRVLDRSKSDLKDGRGSVAKLNALIALAKKKQGESWKWSARSPAPLEIIKAGDVVLVGLAGEIRAYDATDGQERWRAKVPGAVHGLAVAGGQLYASTDHGHVIAFGRTP